MEKFGPPKLPRIVTVGIVGAGIAGLYAALRLEQETIRTDNDVQLQVHVYEQEDRVGGRVFTRRFDSSSDNQYYEAGAMRIPVTDMHKPVINLIDSLGIKRIPYVLSDSGNFVIANSRRGQVNTEGVTAKALGFDLPQPYQTETAADLLLRAIEPLLQLLQADFDGGWEKLLYWDRVSFRDFLLIEAGYPSVVVDFIETITSQTNQYSLSVPELIMQNLDFGVKKWTTIANGMDQLPKTMAAKLGMNKITLQARVSAIRHLVVRDPGSQNLLMHMVPKIKIEARTPTGDVSRLFDKVILAIPPIAVNMIVERPRWGHRKEQALRAMHYEPLYKMGLRFKTRFWETVDTPSHGGQSTTDLRIRWIVYPSYGIKESEPGVLLLYSWITDATAWASVPFDVRLEVALHDLQEAYPTVKIKDQFMEADDVIWSNRSPTGDAAFLPGQFKDHFEIAQQREGDIWFAGEHLSRHHTWIAGAMDSARRVAGEILADVTTQDKRDKLGFGVHMGWMELDVKNGEQKHYNPLKVRWDLLHEKAQEPDFAEKMKKAIFEYASPAAH